MSASKDADDVAECDGGPQRAEGTEAEPDQGRRTFLKGLGATATLGTVLPEIWSPSEAHASTPVRGEVKHVLYIRMAGGFRFTTAFNADVAAEFNPFGTADEVADGTEWGVGKILTDAPWLEGEEGQQLREMGMKPVHRISDDIAVIPCVDHEPYAARADGNHQTGLERFQKGRVDGANSIFTMINYGLRERFEKARKNSEVALPAFSLGDSGMARGAGKYGGYRPPVIQGSGFDDFGFDSGESLPSWAEEMADDADERMLERQNRFEEGPIDSYMETREATASYNEVFNSEALKIGNGSDESIDGLSNAELEQIFGDTGAARNVRLALRLFHFGAPAAYLNQGGYDLHSGEKNRLPDMIDELNRIISGLHLALHELEHPSGGSYWDHTLVVLGSEFGRTAGGDKFNSARGSDHGGDLATRWMSMPMMGGVIDQAGNGGRSFGGTRPSDLKDKGKVYSYRSVMKTLMDALGCDHSEFFQADKPVEDFFT